MLKYSVIMPCRLVPYPSQTKEPEKKFERAVASVIAQTFCDFELLIIADGCEKTEEIYKKKIKDNRVKLLKVNHKGLWDNQPRNTGIDNATGEYIIYCDADDYWGENHLKGIERYINGYDWVWFDDIVYDKRGDFWYIRECNLMVKGRCGTSNICHRRSLGVKWTRPGYAHDYYLIEELKKFKNNRKVPDSEYYVCHIPNNYAV